MKAGKAFATTICAILIGATSSPRVLGQNASAPERPLTANSEDSQLPLPVAAVDPSQGAGGDDAGFSQPCCGPRWTVSAECIIFDRIGTVPYTLVSKAPVPPLSGPSTEVLNATDLHQGFAGGPRLGLIHHGDDDGDLEISYFQIDGWNSYRSIGPTPNNLLIMTAPGNFFQFQDDVLHLNEQIMAWGYTSRLYNAEVNMRWNPWRRVTVLAGFRWAELREELQGLLTPPGTSGAGPFWDTQTKNNLYGVQIGANARLLERGRFSIDGVLKAGVYDNHAEEATSVRMERIQFADSDTTDHFAFLGEIGLQCKYQVTPRLSFTAGYEAMWLEGVALAPGQIAQTYCYSDGIPQNTYVQAMGLNCNSGVFYHGATVGLTYSF
jgi:hypothetical protein